MKSRLALAVASTLLALLAAEGALRLAPSLSRLGVESAQVAPVGKDALGLMTPDAHGEVVYRLRPGLVATLKGKEVRTNAQGFRGPELVAGVRTVVGIGDSVMFGWGVADGETYLRRLERELGAAGDLQVVNMGVPGYHTVQEVALLERHLDVLRPSVAILGFLANDLSEPQPFQKQGLLERHSSLYRLLRLRSAALPGALRLAPERKRSFQALRRLGHVAKERGFPVVVFLYTGMVAPAGVPRAEPLPDVRALCREQGFVEVDLYDVLTKAIAAGEIAKVQDIWVSPTPPIDPHPNARGHELIARELLPAVRAALERRRP